MKLEDRFKKVNIDRETTLNNYSALQCVEISNSETIGFVNWLTNEKSTYSVMYGNQKERFADEEREYTITELLKIYQD